MYGVALLLLAGLLLAAAAGFTTRLLRPDSRLDAAVTWSVVASSGVAVILLVVGTLGRLGAGAVLALEAVWACAAGAILARRGSDLSRPRLPPLQPAILLRHPWEAAVVTLAGVALAWQLLVALVLPPFAFDAITYHLTIVASWLKAGDLDPTSLSLCCAHYPANSELMFAWPVLFLGTDSIVDTVQIGFAVLGALAVAGIARSMGLPRALAAAAGGLFAVTPAVLVQAPTNYADVIIAACVLAALHSLVRFSVTGARNRLVVAGLATGLVLGTKGTGAVWALVLVLVALAVAVALVRAGRISRPGALRGLTLFLSASLALGSYWYARNWIEVGNPAYPFEVRVAGLTVFEGPFQVTDVLTQPDAGRGSPWPVAVVRSWASDLAFWQQGAYDHQQRSGGLGPLWPWLGLPLLLVASVVLVRRRSPVFLAFLAVGFVLVIQPYRWWARFTIPLTAVGALSIAAVATWAPRPWLRTAVKGAALALALVGVALSSYKVDPAARADPLPARDVLGLIGSSQRERSVGRLFFPEYRFLEAVPDDATVVVDLRAEAVRFVYPLFGPRHDREVIPSGSGSPPLDAWVVTARGRPLDRSLRADERFKRVFAKRGVRVFRPAT